MADPLAGLTPSHLAQMRLLCWVAWVDGVVAEEERELLVRLAARLLPELDPAVAVSALVAEESSDLDHLVAQVPGHDERLALVKLAFQLVCSSRDPGDANPINAAERGAYRCLLEALSLPDAEVQEVEWAVRQAMEDSPALLDRFNQALFGWGA